MVDTMLVIVIVVVILAVTGGVKISIGNINIANRNKENDDNE
jgi:biopolymer transport protein ExbD